MVIKCAECVCFPVGCPYVTSKISRIKDHMAITQTPHLMSCYNKGNTFWIVHSFLYKNVVFQVQAEYSYFSADFRLKIFLYYS